MTGLGLLQGERGKGRLTRQRPRRWMSSRVQPGMWRGIDEQPSAGVEGRHLRAATRDRVHRALTRHSGRPGTWGRRICLPTNGDWPVEATGGIPFGPPGHGGLQSSVRLPVIRMEARLFPSCCRMGSMEATRDRPNRLERGPERPGLVSIGRPRIPGRRRRPEAEPPMDPRNRIDRGSVFQLIPVPG